MTKQDLIDFESRIADKFDSGEIPYLIHLSGGNEDHLLRIFKHIKKGDYIFTTHRSHYHYLLAGGSPEKLEDMICNGKSMFVFDRDLNFYSSSIVCATPSIAAGVAWALKRKGSKNKVWCFLGDGAEDEGHLYEAARYVAGFDLPCQFVIEDNGRSVSANKKERWGKLDHICWDDLLYSGCIEKYHYVSTYPHGGSGHDVWIKFKKEAVVEVQPERKIAKPITCPESPLSYKEAVQESMNMLATEIDSVFVGYNVRHGSAYGFLSNIDEKQRLETPLAENLMAGLAMGMSLEGIRPILYFERHDFVYNAMDALVNQLDKIEFLSEGQFTMPVIIKAVVGGIKPFYAGITHTSDLITLFKHIFHFSVFAPVTPGGIIEAYKVAVRADCPVLISEQKCLY